MADKYIQLQSADGLDNLFPTSRLELKWTNSSPTSAFGSQTASFTDASDYNYFFIIVREHTGSARSHTFIISKYGEQVLEFFPYSATPYYLWARPCRVSSTGGITFDPCYGMSSYASYQSTPNNNYCIPTAIYGLK